MDDPLLSFFQILVPIHSRHTHPVDAADKVWGLPLAGEISSNLSKTPLSSFS